MAWYLWNWLAHAALAGFVVLSGGCLAAWLYREPVRRLRLLELTLLGCLIAPWVALVPALPHWSLGLLTAPARGADSAAPQSRGVAAEAPSAVLSVPGRIPSQANQPAGHELRRATRLILHSSAAPAPGQSARRTGAAALNHAGDPADLSPTARAILLAYPVVAAIFLGLWLVGVARLVQLLQTARPAPQSVVDLLGEIAGSAAARVRIVASDHLHIPLTFTWRRPIIMLPAAMCASDDREGLRYCLSHEWSHVERRDIWTWHLTGLVQLFFFYQPLFWWLRTQVRLCQDYLADARAAEHSPMTEDYASYLVRLARARAAGHAMAALGITDRRSNLYRRVVMLLERRENLERSCRWPWTAAWAACALLLLCAVAAVRLDAGVSEDKRKEATVNESSKPKEASKGESFPYTGRVFDKVTNKPIAGAVVTVRRTTYGDPDGERTLAETKHATDADGKYQFVIPPEQASQRFLYIELDVEAPGYAPRTHFGYAFSMIRKNEKLGGRPFFENVELRAGKEITGLIELADGKPAAGVKVLAYSNTDKQDGFEYGSFASARTDHSGRFRLWLTTPGPAVFWLLPERFAPSTHVIKDPNKRGDMGRFVLEPGLIVRGKVLDTQGKPVPGVFVEADYRGGIPDFNQPVANHIRRTALSNERGEFQMAPLPPGEYDVSPQEHGYDPSRDQSRPPKRPVPGVFLRQKLVLKAEEQPEPIEVRAVPHVVIEAQYYDSKGKPCRGHESHMFGRIDKTSHWFGQTRMDAAGKMVLLAPHGLTEARLGLTTNEHGALRYRLKPGAPLAAAREIQLGTLSDDVKGIEIVRYVAPILLADATDKQGKQIKGFQAKVVYSADVQKKQSGEHFVNGVQGDVFMEKQEDGRWRTSQLLPDEEFTVTLSAPGYAEHKEIMKLAEGASKDLTAVLEKK
jgi:beta-lactamase regulating signal transducer with metallopeptidase domain/protocatechuate 3,4-dioxygenase beta subunit